MQILIQIHPPAPQKMFTFPYDATGLVPIPAVGEQIMGYAMGELPIKVTRRLYHYLPDKITVRLICAHLAPEDH